MEAGQIYDFCAMTSPSKQQQLWNSRYSTEGCIWGTLSAAAILYHFEAFLLPYCMCHWLTCDFPVHFYILLNRLLSLIVIAHSGDCSSCTAALLAKLIEPSTSVFECGVGYGRDAIFLAKIGHAVHGIDPSEEGTSDTSDTTDTSLLGLSKSSILPHVFDSMRPS
jgi:hypothetical protein